MTEGKVCPDKAGAMASPRSADSADMGRSPSGSSGQAVLRPCEETAGTSGPDEEETRREDRREIHREMRDGKPLPHAADSVRNDGIADAGAKQRRGGRVSEQVAVVMLGSDAEGRVFAEETHTVVLSQHGAGIVSRHKLMPEQELILRAVELRREAEVRVVGEIAKQGEAYTYGVAFVDEALDFWQREFPAAPVWDQRPEVLVLECVGCKGAEEVKNGDFEYDICVIHGGLVRFCDECGYLTVWKQSHEVIPGRVRKKVAVKEVREVEEVKEVKDGKEVQEEARAEFVSLADAMVGTERRARVRAKVNFFACVVSAEFGEDVVRCVDMSKGGVSFRTKKEYAKEMSVTIAVPYAAEAREAPAIFVKGRIANVKAMESGVWRVGLEFVR